MKEQMNERVNKEIRNFIEGVDELNKEFFKSYREIINNQDGSIDELFKPLTEIGRLEFTREVVRMYVYSIYNEGFKATGKEMNNLVRMFEFMKNYNREHGGEEILLEGYIFSILASAQEQ